MLPHHECAVERLVAHFSALPECEAIIIGGSVAKGYERPDSDIDFQMVVPPEVFDQRLAEHDVFLYGTDIVGYEGGYHDGKIIDIRFLEDVAERGSEVARAAFVKAFVPYARDSRIPELVARCATYPEAEREEKLRTFYAHFSLWCWFVGEAEKRNDPYLMTQAVGSVTLYAGRLFLAWNRRLYPYHKWMLRVLGECPDKPADLVPLLEALLESPSSEGAKRLRECVDAFRPWEVELKESVSRFLIQTEWQWRHRGPNVLEW